MKFLGISDGNSEPQVPTPDAPVQLNAGTTYYLAFDGTEAPSSRPPGRLQKKEN